MDFAIRRTSSWDFEGKNPPCEGARWIEYVRVDERTTDDPAKIPANKGNPKAIAEWWERGRNHRIENGHIMRDFDDHRWEISIGSLDELLAFSEKYGQLVFDSESIEIYDGYRE